MGFDIIKDGQVIGWTASKYADDSVTFVDDTLDIEQDIDTLKANKVQAIKQQATQLLADTDWQLQRANERALLGIKVLERESVNSILIYRESIRKASNRAEAELKKLSNVEDINKFTWEIKTEDSV